MISYVDIVITFLGASLILYTLLGGADFGAGIVEMLAPSKDRKKYITATKEAMGPVWEANHMWLILAVVILFNGFPPLYSRISILLHVPLTLMLLGIIFRGCAFTFRHYDAIQDESTRLYSQVFQLSSLLTPMMIGMMIGALTEGNFTSSFDAGYYAIYVAPWTSSFSFMLGFFVVILFTLLATIFLIGEVNDRSMERFYKRLAVKLCLLAIPWGGIILYTGQIHNKALWSIFLESKFSLGAMCIATLLVICMYQQIRLRKKYSIRVLVGATVSLIVLGWFDLIFPTVIRYADTSASLGLYNSVAGDITLSYLTSALLLGSLIIFPSILYLFKIFKSVEISK